MKTLRVGLIVLVLAMPLYEPALAQTGHDLFQQALVMEQAEGNLRAAIQLYGRIVDEFSTDRGLVARALVQMGGCHEKLGSMDAERAYRRVVSEFMDQADMVAEARSRLAALRSESAAPSRGPVARRVLSGSDTDEKDFRDMYPSPDGRRVAYADIDFALKVRDLASGEVHEIAPGVQSGLLHYSPRWSPDGRRLAVTVHDTTDATATASGPTMIRLIDVATHEAVDVPGTKSHQWKEPIVWSEDGRHLLTVRWQDGTHLELIAVDNGRVTAIADSAGEGTTGSLSADGRYVAYAIGEEAVSQIFVQPVTGGMRRQITETAGGANNPVWSPDGSAIAYRRPGGIWLIPVRDGRAAGPSRLALSTAEVRLWAWTEAGLFYTQNDDAEMSATPYQIQMDPHTGEPGTGGLQPLSVSHPRDFTKFVWSPDMRRVAFFSGRGPGPRLTIRSVDTDAAATYDLGEGAWLGHTWWSGDGEQVLAAYAVTREECTVISLDLATGERRQLFPPIAGATPGFSMSADGQWMSRYNLEDFGTARRMGSVAVSATGEVDARIVATARSPEETSFSGAVRPRLSPQGDKVLFARQKYDDPLPQDGASLWVVGSDGSGARRLGTLTFIASAIWDPSGRFIAYTGRPDSAQGSPSVLRVVEVETGVEHEVPLGDTSSGTVFANDWSSDGQRLGIVAGPYWDGVFVPQGRSEYWVVQGLLEGGRNVP